MRMLISGIVPAVVIAAVSWAGYANLSQDAEVVAADQKTAASPVASGQCDMAGKAAKFARAGECDMGAKAVKFAKSGECDMSAKAGDCPATAECPMTGEACDKQVASWSPNPVYAETAAGESKGVCPVTCKSAAQVAACEKKSTTATTIAANTE